MTNHHITVILCLTAALSSCNAAERLRLEVAEPAGIQRSNYPVHTRLELSRPVPAGTKFRLLLDDQPVIAQFRPNAVDVEQPTNTWWLDFQASLAPQEVRRYEVVYGENVEPSPERRGGHQLNREPNAYVISNAPYIDWRVPNDVRGFLTSVDFPPAEHLRPDSPGLLLRDREGNVHPLGGEGTTCRVLREGRMTVALRFERAETVAELTNVRWTADLTFPGPVSWVELSLRIHDPDNRVAAVGMSLQLNLDESTGRTPTIVDLGASRTVYSRLATDAVIELQADAEAARPWSILRGKRNELRPFTLAPSGSPPAEGWAHIMDRKRCLAIAFDRFGREGADRIRVAGNGDFEAWKQFRATTNTDKRWRSWLHFVHFPPQASATADPQQMQHPIVARQLSD